MTIKNPSKDIAPNYRFTLRFNPEILRLIAYISLICVLLLGSVVTATLVDVDPHSTTIYKLFGFNHACNVIDHEPSRTISAMLWPFWEIPFALYVVFNFLRIQDAYREQKAPKYVFIIAAIFLPIELSLTVWARLIFVHSPAVNFLSHYLPYIGLQILLFLVAFENALYFYAMKALPFNNNRSITIGYLCLVFATTLLCVTFGLAIALGHPILDPANNIGQRVFFRALSNFYLFLVLMVPLGLSWFEMKRSPDHTISVS